MILQILMQQEECHKNTEPPFASHCGLNYLDKAFFTISSTTLTISSRVKLGKLGCDDNILHP
jgi:hypothetical protein